VWGAAIWIIATLFYLRDNWRTLSWGPRNVCIPLWIIAGAIALSGVTAPTLAEKFAPGLMALSMFALFLVSRKLGKDVFLPLGIGAGIAAAGVVIQAVLTPGAVTGGLIFEHNYDIVVGYVLLGSALFVHRLRWLLAGLALVAMLLTGSPEGVFAVAVLVILILWRRDWGRKLVFTLVPARC